MTKCVFCGREVSPYKGVHLITNDGSMNFYCSSKCRRNALNLKRDKKKLKWTEAYRIVKAKTAAKEAAKKAALKPEAEKKETKPNKK
jgi:large subunit ribosomal protein L24e